MDLAMKVRKVARCLGVDVVLHTATPPFSVECFDRELGGRRFFASLGTASRRLANLKAFHEQIYHERAKQKYIEQEGKCAHCGRDLKGSGQCDHRLSRGAHGRDDRSQNLQIVCSVFSGGCDFHARKHGA